MAAKTPPPGDQPEDDTGVQIRPFADWLREQSKGTTHDELSVALNDLIQRVQDTRKKGQIVFTIDVGPLPGDKSGIIIGDKIKLKLPEHDRAAAFYFVDKHGNPVREDPNQPAFESLREVGGIGQVNTKTGEVV